MYRCFRWLLPTDAGFCQTSPHKTTDQMMTLESLIAITLHLYRFFNISATSALVQEPLNTYLLQRLLQIKGGQESLKLSSILGKQYETTIPHEPVFIAAKSLCILRWSERRLRKASTVLFVTRDFLRTFNGLAVFSPKKKNTSLLVLIHQRALRQRIRCRRMSL